jgi:hypothetical protein
VVYKLELLVGAYSFIQIIIASQFLNRNTGVALTQTNVSYISIHMFWPV